MDITEEQVSEALVLQWDMIFSPGIMQEVADQGRLVSVSLHSSCNHFPLPLDERDRVNAAVCDALTTSLSNKVESEVNRISKADVVARLKYESTRVFAAQRQLLRETERDPQWMLDICEAIDQLSGFGLKVKDCGTGKLAPEPNIEATRESETGKQLLMLLQAASTNLCERQQTNRPAQVRVILPVPTVGETIETNISVDTKGENTSFGSPGLIIFERMTEDVVAGKLLLESFNEEYPVSIDGRFEVPNCGDLF